MAVHSGNFPKIFEQSLQLLKLACSLDSTVLLPKQVFAKVQRNVNIFQY